MMIHRIRSNSLMKRICSSQQINQRFLHEQTSDKNVITGGNNLKFPNQDVYSFFKQKFEEYGDQVALIDCLSEEQITYNGLLKKSNQLASFFQSKGYKSQDCAAIQVPNSIYYPIVLYGAMAKGMIFTSANPAFTSFETRRQLVHSEAKILFSNSKLLDEARRCCENTNVDLIISMDETTVNDSGVMRLADILNKGDENFANDTNIDPSNDVALLLYSSGTTGAPKGVMLTHKNVVTNVLQTVNQFPYHLSKRRSCLCFFPFFHIGGLHVALNCEMYAGNAFHVLPSFDPETFLSSMEKYKADRTYMVPPVGLFMLNHPSVNNYDLSAWKSVIIGAAPVAKNIMTALQTKFPHVKFLQAYGLTEGMITHGQTDDDVTENKVGSAGKLFQGIEMKICCLETGEALPAYESGEVCFRGPQVMKGYWQNIDATKDCISDDGWLRTGDIGHYDDKLNLFISDRLKELIKYKGYQVAPAELEDVLLTHKDILDCCVIGTPDKRAGELPFAFIVKVQGSTITEEDIHTHMKNFVADYKQLRGGVEFVEEIPKSPAGKILRRILRDEHINSLS